MVDGGICVVFGSQMVPGRRVEAGRPGGGAESAIGQRRAGQLEVESLFAGHGGAVRWSTKSVCDVAGFEG